MQKPYPLGRSVTAARDFTSIPWFDAPMSVIRVTIRVKPGASRSKVGGSYGEPAALVVSVHAQPVDGQANTAVIDAIASVLDVRKADVSVVAGHTGRTKILAIKTADPESIQLRIDELMAR